METEQYDNTTMIRVTSHTKEELRKMKEGGESFNNVISKMIKTVNEAKLRISEKE